MMKALFALYHDYNFEARAPELIKVLRLLGINEITIVTYETPRNLPDVTVRLSKKGYLKFFSFLFESIRWIKKEKPDVILLHDNAAAPILAYLVKRRYPGKTVYDSSELYIDPIKVKSIKLLIARIRPYCEKKYLKSADVVLAANDERAAIMKDYFSLDEKPLVLNNIHRIEDPYDEQMYRKKYEEFIIKDSFFVVYGGGVYSERRTCELARVIKDLGREFTLLIAGSGEEKEIEKLKLLIENNTNNNVVYTGRLPRAEWRYLTIIADCSVSMFPQDTPNNIYCASGKFYESVLEGTPVIASENPPFLNACEEYGFGVSSNNLPEALIEMRNNYHKYKENAVCFAKTFDYRGRLVVLAEQIKNRLNKVQ